MSFVRSGDELRRSEPAQYGLDMTEIIKSFLKKKKTKLFLFLVGGVKKCGLVQDSYENGCLSGCGSRSQGQPSAAISA